MKTPHEQPPIRVEIPWDNGTTIDGRVVEVALGIVSASFGPHASALRVGEALTLKLIGEGIGGAIEVSVELSETCPWGDGHLVAFRFSDTEEFGAFMAIGGGKWFNRRRDYRVCPLATEPVTLTVCKRGAEPLTLRALNVSAGGVSFCPSSSQAASFELGDRVTLSLRLPSEPGEVELATVVRFRGISGEREVVGLEFDAKKSRRFFRTEDAIISYIMQRQRQTLSSAS
jgi:hypothetical protein